MRAALFYKDGSVYEGDPALSPTEGLVCIAQQRPPGDMNKAPRLIADKEWFVFVSGEWRSEDQAAAMISGIEAPALFRKGTMVLSDNDYLAIRKRASEWVF